MIGDIFTCALCGNEYRMGISDEQADAEAVALYGEEAMQAETGIICDDCFQVFLPWARAQGLIK